MADSFATPSFNVDDLFSVAGRTVVVTGGGSGLGKIIATAFATNGAKVFISGRRKDVLEKAAAEINAVAANGGQAIAIQADTSTKATIKTFYEEVAKQTDVVDVLFNCAGIMRIYKDATTDVNNIDAVAKMLWEGHEDDDFNATNQINVNGVYFTTVAFVPLLLKSDLRSVVVISSIAATILQRSMGSISYGASKAAALHTANMLAGRLAPGKIRVNTICPGTFPSEMTGSVTKEGGLNYELSGPSGKAALRSVLGRAGRPHEIAGPALLLGSRAGSYMDGAVMTVCGGRQLAALGINDGVRMPDETYIN